MSEEERKQFDSVKVLNHVVFHHISNTRQCNSH